MFDGAHSGPPRAPLCAGTMLKFHPDFSFIHIDLNPLVCFLHLAFPGSHMFTPASDFRVDFDLPDPFYGALFALAPFVHPQV